MASVRRVGRLFIFGLGLSGTIAGIVSCGGGGGSTPSSPTTGGPITKASLGKALFFDTTLSNPVGESCGTCHSPTKVFTDPRPGPTSEGAVKGVFGDRHAPSIMYMAYSPTFSITGGEAGGCIGGQFWDGRAATLFAQPVFPLTNPFEMNNPSPAAVVAKVAAGPEAAGMKAIYGANVFSNASTAFTDIVDAIVAFEKEPAISPFTSKYDAFLAGNAQLTPTELAGLAVFNGKAGCAGCHTSAPAPDGTPPLFTNFCYANLGLPKNPNNPYYTDPTTINPSGSGFVDIGLQKTTGSAQDAGNFMTPTLRNVAARGPYFHNGIFTTLAQVINFYNTRDLGGFAPPEVPQTEDTTELGNLHLTATESTEIIAFLQTLTDGYTTTSQFKGP